MEQKLKFLKDRQLSDYTTMRLGGKAKEIVEVSDENDVIEAVKYAETKSLPIIVLGGGSNIVFGDNGFGGLIIINRLKGIKLQPLIGEAEVAAGEKWDDLVKLSIEANLCGIEAMSYIPGTVGACPINNIGAYGQEVAEVIKSVRAYDVKSKEFVEIDNKQCKFDYRNSRFKSEDYGRFIICSVKFRLKKFAADYVPPKYKSIQEELEKEGIHQPTPKDIRHALAIIRGSKLPDSRFVANTGSFFKNPSVPDNEAHKLIEKFSDMPQYPQNNGKTKLAAGWLIEQAGLKNYRQDGIWVYDKQALVLVNESAKNFKDLKKMYQLIQKKVKEKFGVLLEPEPEIIE